MIKGEAPIWLKIMKAFSLGELALILKIRTSIRKNVWGRNAAKIYFAKLLCKEVLHLTHSNSYE